MFGQSLLSAFGSAACTTDTDQLLTTDVQTTSLATYQLNNATTSIPNNTYPGTFTGPAYATGKFGNAASFGGSNYITVTGFTSTTTFSYSFWVNPTNATSSGYKAIIGNQLSGGQLFTDAGALKIYASTTLTFSGSPTLADNTWSHVALSVSNGTGTIYVNGINKGTASGLALPSTSYIATASTQVGNSVYNYTGKIDQIRVFNSALSQAAVTALYNETTTTATYDYVEYETPNPNSIAYYKMSDATDQLGNYNGTATNVNFNTEGKFGFAGAFNGVNTRITTSLTTPNTQDLSWSFWVKDLVHNGSSTDNTLLLNYKNNYAFINYTSSNTIYANARNSSTNANVDVQSSAIDTSIWRHIVFVSSLSSGSFLYIDGALVDSNTASMPSRLSINYGSGLEIGWNPAEGSPFTSYRLEGKIDQVRIYDSALSAANVTTLYNEIECPAVAVTNAFNTVLYTGNGGTQAVTGTGFEPALVWIKERSNTAWHILTDSIRGENKAIYSNDTHQEESLTNVMNSFDSNGFTVGYNAAYSSVFSNKNGENYVAWNWKAPLANLSTSFNGSSSHIDLGTTDFVQNNNSLSISAWCYFEDLSTANPIVTKWNNSGIEESWWFGHYGGGSTTLHFAHRDSANNVTTSYSNTGAISENTWHHCVGVWGGNTVTYYVDGTQVGTSTNSNFDSPTKTSNANIIIGAQNEGSVNLMNGKIDQVRMFNTALSASEVSDLYAEPAASNNTLNYPAGAGCIAAYPLQTDAVDLSGNYNGASSNVTFGQPGYLTGNTNGTIPSTVAANVDAGFSIVEYTGTGSNASFGHGLSLVPELVIVKRTSASEDWFVLYDTANTPPNYMKLNTTAAGGTSSGVFPSPATSTVVNVGNDTSTNSSGSTYIAYAFHSVDGYSKIGSYTGTGATGNVQYVGFEPSFVMLKRTDIAGSWNIIDNRRGDDNYLQANTSAAEGSMTAGSFDLTSTGFTLDNSFSEWNASGGNYIFLAIA